MESAEEPRRDGNGHDEPAPARRDEHEREDHERDEPGRDDRGRDEPERAPKKPREPLRRRAARWRHEHPRGFILVLVALVAAVVIGSFVIWYFHTHESTDDAQIDGHIAPISARVAGTVAAVHVEDNTAVAAGQLLVELDPRDYQVALARAQADLMQARAQLEAESPNVPITATTNTTQIATATDDVDSARAAIIAAGKEHQSAIARVQEAQANDQRAEFDLARYKYLLAQRAIPQERFDQVVATAKSTHAELDSAHDLARSAQKTVEQQQARLQQALSREHEASRNAPHQISIREANIAAKEAAVKAAEAAVERARLDLSYCKVAAPVAGVVGKRSVEPGQRVQPGEELLAVVELDDLWVTANFKETQVGRLRVGQPVKVKVDALGWKLDGSVESFAGASGARYSLLPPENATGNYVKVVQRLPVRIHLDLNQDERARLRPGMSVEPNVSLR